MRKDSPEGKGGEESLPTLTKAADQTFHTALHTNSLPLRPSPHPRPPAPHRGEGPVYYSGWDPGLWGIEKKQPA